MGLKLVLFGRQGAGKGTQSALLAKHYGAVHISTGDMLREAVAEGTEFGRQAKQYMDSGALLPDEIMLGIITERLAQPDATDGGFLLDGFPRTLGQADALLGITSLDVAVNIEVPRDVVLERLSSRRVCTNCGAIYSLDEPPTNPWTCDVCGGQVVQRDDDTPEAIGKRLAAYERDTVPAIERFGRARPARERRRSGPSRRGGGPHRGRHRRPRLEMRTLRAPAPTVRSRSEVAKMRKAGRVVAEMHERIRAAVAPGVTTLELDAVGRDVIERRGATSNFLGYHGFPAVICASPNNVIVHGIPDGYRLRDGDIISIDCGAIVDGLAR